MNTDPITATPTSTLSTGTGTSGTAPQGQDSALYNPNAQAGQAGSLDPTMAPVSQTQDASQINSQMAGGSTGVIFPQAPGAPTTGTSANTSVPNPIPSAADIVSQGTQSTPAEATNQSLLQKVASLIGQKKGQTELTNTSEAAAGVPALAKTLNDLNTQLEGLNNQATDLQNQASSGGAIENTEQQNALGRGITSAGLAPLTAADLRKNQIQQSAIASQSLTLKSAIYGAQGKLTLAKDAADKAATAQYEAQQIQIDYQSALIAANLPSMTKQEKAQADLVTQNLADRQRQLDQAKDDKKTIIAMATAVMQAYPNDPAAHYAAQQALAESNKQQPDLQTALGLVGKYQSLDTQKQIADLALTRANTAKANADASKALQGTTPGNQDPAIVNGWVTSVKSGAAKLSDLTGNPALKNAVVAAMAAGGTSQSDILETTLTSLKSLQDMVDKNKGFSGAVGAKGLSSFFGLKSTPIPGTAAADFDAKLNQVKNDVILPNLTLLHGLGRVTDREFQALSAAITSLGTNESEGQFKTDLKTITDQITAKSQGSHSGGTTLMTGPDGNPYNVPNDQVAAFKAAGGY